MPELSDKTNRGRVIGDCLSAAARHSLTELQYSTDRKGPWKLYVYGANGYHSGGQWFSKAVRYPDEEITVAQAKGSCDLAVASGYEVRVCDGGDLLVYHAKDGKVLYGETFWLEIAQ
jgi:hypothetical protein